MRLLHGLRAFRHRDYRYFLAGKGLAQVGMWV